MILWWRSRKCNVDAKMNTLSRQNGETGEEGEILGSPLTVGSETAHYYDLTKYTNGGMEQDSNEISDALNPSLRKGFRH